MQINKQNCVADVIYIELQNQIRHIEYSGKSSAQFERENRREISLLQNRNSINNDGWIFFTPTKAIEEIDELNLNRLGYIFCIKMKN